MTARFDLVGLIVPPAIQDALCATETAGRTASERIDLFYADDRTDAGRRQVERAKTICAACPARLACAEHALVRRERHGVWGGMSELDRRRLFRRDQHRRNSRRAAAGPPPIVPPAGAAA